MPDKRTTDNGRYLYAVLEENAEMTFGDIGINGSDVYSIVEGNISAVVSNVPDRKIRPQRKNVAAHHAVLNTIMKRMTPLPMAFGIIADGEKAIRKILSDSRKVFREQFAMVSGKVEMGVRVSYDVPNIFEYFISTHPDIRAARDRYFGGGRDPGQEAKLELGRMFNEKLDENREEYADMVMDVLDDYCDDIKENRCRNEHEVMNLACLIHREDQKRFEEGVFKSAGLFDDHFSFEYNGPWSPHNFVHIQISV